MRCRPSRPGNSRPSLGRDGKRVVLGMALAAVPCAAAAQYAGTGTNPFSGLPVLPSTSVAGGPPGWRVTPFVNVLGTATNNVNLQPSGQTEADLVTQLTPGLRIQGNSARASLNGSISATGLVYVNTTENNRVVPQASLLGRVHPQAVRQGGLGQAHRGPARSPS